MSKKVIALLIVSLSVGLLIVGTALMNDIRMEKYFIKLDYEQFAEMIENEESFPLLFVKDDCAYCNSFKPKAMEVSLNYETNIYYINTSDLDENDVENIYKDFPVYGTPTVIFVRDGKELYINNRIVGDTTKGELIEGLRANNYIE